MHRFARIVAVVAFAAFFGACTDQTTVTPATPTPTPTPTSNAVLSVTVSPASSTLIVGQSEVLASVVTATGTIDRTTTWSSNDPTIATVDGTGKVTAIAPGTTTIIATSKGDPNVKGAASVVVQAANAASQTAFNGTYNGAGSASTNTCGFNANPVVSGLLTMPAQGPGTWTVTHIAAGVSFNFTGVVLNVLSPTAASFNASTTQSIGGQLFGVNDVVTISGTTILDKQTLTSQVNGCMVVYNFTFLK